MGVVDEVIQELQAIERELYELEQPALARRIHAVAATLAGEPGQWISVETARRLAGVDSDETIHTWIRLGLLRSRQNVDGIRVKLDDVLHQCRVQDALSGFGKEDDDPVVEHWGWSGRLPWRDEETAVAE